MVAAKPVELGLVRNALPRPYGCTNDPITGTSDFGIWSVPLALQCAERLDMLR